MLPDATDAIRLLSQLGVQVIVVSNRRGAALGLQVAEVVIIALRAPRTLASTKGREGQGEYRLHSNSLLRISSVR